MHDTEYEIYTHLYTFFMFVIKVFTQSSEFSSEFT